MIYMKKEWISPTPKKTQLQIEEELHSVYPNIDIISEYTGANEKALLHCNECGHEWWTTARSVVHSKHGCPNCGVEKALREKSIQKFKNKLLNTNFEYIDYVEKRNGIHIVKVKCKTCGTIRETNMNNILRFGCDTCTHKKMPQCQPRTKEEFIKRAISIHGNKYDYSKIEYKNDKIKVCIICPKHGEFWQTPNKHLIGQGCHLCASSGLEQITNTILEESKLNYYRQYCLYIDTQKLFIDFVIEHNNQKYFIELNGQQHYKAIDYFGGEERFKKQIERDQILDKYCKDNNINLYWIRYDSNIKTEVEKIIKQITAV